MSHQFETAPESKGDSGFTDNHLADRKLNMHPRYMGRDCELSSTGVDGDGDSIDPGRVTREVLRQIPAAFAANGAHVWSERSRFASSSMDCLRNWASNGACHYADMAHVECCTPTCLDPFDFAAHCWNMVRAAEEARKLAQRESDEAIDLSLSTSNADLLDPSISFGSHLSASISESLWEDLFHTWRRPSRLAMVASGLAGAIPFFGAGYLLPFKDRTIYSLSARAHHISRITSMSTTDAFRRGILNSRREAHGRRQDRLHIIGFDFCLPSSPLLCSFVQCLLAAAEEDFCGLQLLDPVRALRVWSWGLDLQTGRMEKRATLVDGRQLTLPEYFGELTQTLLRMAETGLIPAEVAPRATALLPRIVDLTRYAAEGSLNQCAAHLSWAAKLLCLLNVCEDDPEVEFGDATTRLIDHDFGNTDPERGTIWQLWDEGLIDPLITREEMEAAWRTPPAGSRDIIRGRLIERFGEQIYDVDWDCVELRETEDRWGPRIRVNLPNLDRASNSEIEQLIAGSRTVRDLGRRLDGNHWSRHTDPIDDVTNDLVLPNPDSTWSGSVLEA